MAEMISVVRYDIDPRIEEDEGGGELMVPRQDGSYVAFEDFQLLATALGRARRILRQVSKNAINQAGTIENYFQEHWFEEES